MTAPSRTTPHTITTARRTVARPAVIRGVGLFTCKPSVLTIAPLISRAMPGIVIRRVDLPGSPSVSAHVQYVAPERRRTLLVTDGGSGQPRVEVHTVEHVLSALAGFGITDATLDLDGPEMPIGDGSATPFVEAILAAGVIELLAHEFPPVPPIVIRQPLVVSEGAAEIRAFPSDRAGCEMTYELDYGDAAPIPRQSATLHVDPSRGVPDYAAEVARARTFCLRDEAIAMRKLGMFQGFEPKDLLVIGPDGPIENAYRFPNEPARHKLLDMLGDLSLASRPIQGRIVAKRSGHALNHQMAGALSRLPS